eukprot:3302449-Amphidinium_carterae.2
MEHTVGCLTMPIGCEVLVQGIPEHQHEVKCSTSGCAGTGKLVMSLRPVTCLRQLRHCWLPSLMQPQTSMAAALWRAHWGATRYAFVYCHPYKLL